MPFVNVNPFRGAQSTTQKKKSFYDTLSSGMQSKPQMTSQMQSMRPTGVVAPRPTTMTSQMQSKPATPKAFQPKVAPQSVNTSKVSGTIGSLGGYAAGLRQGAQIPKPATQPNYESPQYQAIASGITGGVQATQAAQNAGSGIGAFLSANAGQQQPSVSGQSQAAGAGQQQAQDPTERYLQALQQMNSGREQSIQARAAAEAADQQRLFDITKGNIEAQIPELQGQLGQFRQNTLADIEAMKQAGARQKASRAEDYGSEVRDAVKARNETMAANQRTYAGLNTLDSYGEGSFGQANENTASDFERYRQQLGKQRLDEFAGIDSKVAEAERNALANMEKETATYNNAIRELKTSLAQGNLQNAQQLRQIAAAAEDNISKIQSSMMEFRQKAEQAKYDRDMELQKSFQDLSQLSQGFLQTGQPETQQDMQFIIKNPQGANTFANLLKQKQQPDTAQANNTIEALGTVDRISTSNALNNAVGMNQWRGMIPGTPEYGVRQEVDRLKGILSLAARGQLKGQGQISDRETQMLSAAATSLDMGMDPDTFRRELKRVKQVLLESPSLQGTDLQQQMPQAGQQSNDPQGIR